MKENCSHFKTEGRWVIEYDDELEKNMRVWEEREVSACEDISFTQYKCMLCGKVGNY